MKRLAIEQQAFPADRKNRPPRPQSAGAEFRHGAGISSTSPMCASCSRAKFAETTTPFSSAASRYISSEFPSTGGRCTRFATAPTSIAITMIGAFFTITRTLRTGCTSATPSIARRPSASDAGNTKLRAGQRFRGGHEEIRIQARCASIPTANRSSTGPVRPAKSPAPATASAPQSCPKSAAAPESGCPPPACLPPAAAAPATDAEPAPARTTSPARAAPPPEPPARSPRRS